MCITLVTRVCHNEQPGDLEAREGAQVTVPLPRRSAPASGCRFPGISSGPVTSAKARGPVDPAEAREHEVQERWRESIRDSTPFPARSAPAAGRQPQ
jgi:hypothetical protein